MLTPRGPRALKGEGAMDGAIFINYRRSMTAAAAGRLHDRLEHHFSKNDLFMDVDAIEPGLDFVITLNEQVNRCRAFVAVIGPNWAGASDGAGQRRLDNPDDYVRIEIEAALQRNVRVIPVLVDGAPKCRRRRSFHLRSGP